MNLTDGELIEYSKEHLDYEISMLLSISKIDVTQISIGTLAESKQFLLNIIIESFVIHLRIIITFLYPTRLDHPDDVTASDFFSDRNKWKRIQPPISETLEMARTRAHKELGHLTTLRIKGIENPSKRWMIKELVAEIVPILRLFYSEADESKLDKDALQYLND